MEGIVSWNVPNWITIVLMVAIGGLVIGTASQVYKSYAAAA